MPRQSFHTYLRRVLNPTAAPTTHIPIRLASSAFADGTRPLMMYGCYAHVLYFSDNSFIKFGMGEVAPPPGGGKLMSVQYRRVDVEGQGKLVDGNSEKEVDVAVPSGGSEHNAKHGYDNVDSGPRVVKRGAAMDISRNLDVKLPHSSQDLGSNTTGNLRISVREIIDISQANADIDQLGMVEDFPGGPDTVSDITEIPTYLETDDTDVSQSESGIAREEPVKSITSDGDFASNITEISASLGIEDIDMDYADSGTIWEDDTMTASSKLSGTIVNDQSTASFEQNPLLEDGIASSFSPTGSVQHTTSLAPSSTLTRFSYLTSTTSVYLPLRTLSTCISSLQALIFRCSDERDEDVEVGMYEHPRRGLKPIHLRANTRVILSPEASNESCAIRLQSSLFFGGIDEMKHG